jgi:tetratricopeptide (TPR) repeat protein
MNQPATPERTQKACSPPTEKPGDRIGRYKLLEQIGEGGCGIVYVAEQEQPVRRRIALKIIKLGMDTRQVIARFEAERQALALMDHPNISQIHDAGTTENGRPYFAMELVRGLKITDYCEQNQVSTRERLDLFIQVCRAIQHAHQKGVIHRDIKPSNILVASDNGVPVPKVIDFGIAKATQGRLTNQTVYTAFEQFIGTPAYMSPEQAQLTMQDIDTRSDIYSLGVLLYELLTGTTPFDAKELLSKGLDEMRRTIREVEPAKPSTRLRNTAATAAPVRAVTPHSPLATDLDWIVMKCLEKDRARRYETANGLATDVARHLNNEAIIARPPSKLYRLQKAAQRNKVAFAAAGAVMAALVFGLCVSTWALVRERAARREAEASGNLARAEAARNEAVNRFFANSPALGIRGGQDTTLVRAIMGELSRRAETELATQPDAQGDIWVFIASRNAELDDYPAAIINLQKAVAAFRRAYTSATPQLARALGLQGRRIESTRLLAKAYAAVGKRDEAKTFAQEALNLAPSDKDLQTFLRKLESEKAEAKTPAN